MTSRRLARWAALGGLMLGLGLLLTVSTAKPAAADNCQDFSDCFATANSASDALLGLTFLGMLSMALNFIPYVGTAKGIIEAITGRDLLTGQELTATDRLLGLIPGGLGKGGRFAKIFGKADDVEDLARLGARSDDVADASRIRPDMPPPRPGGGPPEVPPGGRRPPSEPPGPPPRRPPEGPIRDSSGRWADPDHVARYRDTWWNPNRPTRTPNGQETSVPRHPPSKTHRATGQPEAIKPKMEERNRLDIEAQNRNADPISQHGFDVDQNGYRGTGEADYIINGHKFDFKRPTTDRVENLVNTLNKSANNFLNKGTQADRLVVDLSHTSITPEQIAHQIRQYPPGTTNIQEVLGIDAHGNLFPIFP